MTSPLKEIVPWGRAFDEYRSMFALTEDDLARQILGCADGPASFNAELTARGGSVVSSDPIYAFSASEIRQRIEITAPQIIEYARENADEFVWTETIPDVNALAEHRMQAMERFLSDFEAGCATRRYIAAALPTQPFGDRTFDLALCSHFLFLYSTQLSEAFHIESVRSLLRVAKEVRIFPLLEISARPSRHIEAVTQFLQSAGYRVDIDTVDYEFQRGGNQMMRIVQ